MSLFTIIKLSTYIYFLTSLLLPEKMIDLTAQLLSLIIIPLPIDAFVVIPHVLKSILLLVRFVVLYTILGGTAIYALVKKEENREKKASIPRKQPTLPPIQQNDYIKMKQEPKVDATKNISVAKEETAANNTAMQSAADSTLPSTKTTTTVKKEAEPMTAPPIIVNKDISIEPVNETIPTTTQELENEDTKSKAIPSTIVADNDKSTASSQSEEKDNNDDSTQQLNNNNDGIITAKTTETPSVVSPILVQDQLTKDNNIPTTTPAIEHVIPYTINNNTTTVYNTPTIKPEITQPENITEASIPQLRSEDQEEEEHRSITTASTTITPPAEPSSNDSKEQYYSEINKKDSNLMSLSDNLQRIFDELPSTPLPQLDTSIISNLTHSSDDAIINNNTTGRKSNIEEMMSTPTPALTPPQANSTSSRRSSTISTKSNSPAFKSKLQTAMQKMAKSGPRQSQPQQLPAEQLPQPPQQQTLNSNKIETSNSSTLLKENSKSRFSSLRLTKKKSTGSTLSSQPPPPPPPQQKQPEPPVLEVKRSVSTKLQSKLKKSGKRLSKIFS